MAHLTPEQEAQLIEEIELRRYKDERVRGPYSVTEVGQEIVKYPDIGEQLDKLFHDIENDTLDTTGEFYTALKAVKDHYPKPV